MWGQKSIWWPKYITNSLPICTDVLNKWAQESGIGKCHLQKYQMSHRGGHTHDRDKIECMATNQIHCRSMSYNYIKCSREQYIVDLHLKIKNIYMYSIYLLEADKAWWLETMSSKLEHQLQNLQNSCRSVIWVYDCTTQRSSTAHRSKTPYSSKLSICLEE